MNTMGAEGSPHLIGDGRAGQPESEAPTFPAGPYTTSCPSCAGSGWDATYADSQARGDRCTTCKGAGWLRVEWRPQLDGSVTFIQHGPADPDQGELGL